MTDETIKKIEDKISNTSQLSDSHKQELLDLVSRLKDEVSSLSKIDAESAQSIASFAEVTAHEAMRKTKNEELLNTSVSGLNTAVKEFEVSHPRLVEVVNQICMMLSNSGI